MVETEGSSENACRVLDSNGFKYQTTYISDPKPYME